MTLVRAHVLADDLRSTAAELRELAARADAAAVLLTAQDGKLTALVERELAKRAA